MPALPPLALETIRAFIVGFIVLNVIIGMVTYVTLLERKFAARMQSRIGPYRVGPHGLLQPIADTARKNRTPMLRSATPSPGAKGKVAKMSMHGTRNTIGARL